MVLGGGAISREKGGVIYRDGGGAIYRDGGGRFIVDKLAFLLGFPQSGSRGCGLFRPPQTHAFLGMGGGECISISPPVTCLTFAFG